MHAHAHMRHRAGTLAIWRIIVCQDRYSAWRCRAAFATECPRLPSCTNPGDVFPKASALHLRCRFASRNWASVSRAGTKRKSRCHALGWWNCPPKPANGELWRFHLCLPKRMQPNFPCVQTAIQIGSRDLETYFCPMDVDSSSPKLDYWAVAKSFTFSIPISKFLLIRSTPDSRKSIFPWADQ